MKPLPEQIRCYRCQLFKPPSEFYASKNRRPYGLSSSCKTCFAERRQALPKAKKRSYEVNKGHILKTKFNMSLEEYNVMLEQQGGVCAICRQPESDVHPATGKPQALAVDHDPQCCAGKKSCGKCIRGLLCAGCNKGIGSLKHDVQILQEAIKYLSEVWT